MSDITKSYEQLVLELDTLRKELALEKVVSNAMRTQSDDFASLSWSRKQEIEALQGRLTIAEQRNTELEKALMFYSDGNHLLLADPDEWDTCSGEPINWLHDAAGTASVEDGSVAKQALVKPTESGASE